MFTHIDPRELYSLRPHGEGDPRTKIGIARDSIRRKNTHQTSQADELGFSLRVFFYHAQNAETYIRRRLTDMGYHIRGEWFNAPRDVVEAVFAEAKAREAVLAQLIEAAYHRNRLSQPISARNVTLECEENSALRTLLATAIRFRGASVTTRGLLQEALSATTPGTYRAPLTKVGLLLIPDARLALIDKRSESRLYSLFEKASPLPSWKSHLQGIAGFNEAMQPIKLREFSKSVWATPDLLEVCVD